jgi:hypothetical protein
LNLYDHPPADGRVICVDLYRQWNYADVAGGAVRTVPVGGLLAAVVG